LRGGPAAPRPRSGACFLRKNGQQPRRLTHSHPLRSSHLPSLFIPGLSALFTLLAEPAGAAAGVAYLMSFILSSPAVDPATLAPKGTLLSAEKAADARGAVRVPFTKIIPTALAVIDPSNSGSSGAGWKASEGGLPKLPLNSVLIVLGVGGLILEAAAHAPVLSLFMPRVLTVAAWLAAAGWALDKREGSA
jgi:hypothetical protein